jgi:hypothetical protein
VSWVRRLGYTKCDIHVKVTWQWLWSWILFKLGIPLKATLQGTQQWAPGPEQPVCCAYGRHMTISPTPEQPVCCACGSHMTMSPMQVWWAQGHYYNKSISPVPPCSTRMAQHRTKGRRAGIAHWNTQGEHDSSLTHQNWNTPELYPNHAQCCISQLWCHRRFTHSWYCFTYHQKRWQMALQTLRIIIATLWLSRLLLMQNTHSPHGETT